jgi:gamma-glutamylcyclotransferase (GGCT)/AIG2-like uncharacterized protein YtfP
MQKCCFYGSLRRPLYNYERFVNLYGEQEMQYKKTIRIPNFKLYDLGYYPAVVRTEEECTVVVDLFDIGESAFTAIKYMELGAGYNLQLVNIDGENYNIFCFEPSQLKHCNLIPSGDYLNFSIQNNISI